MTNIAVVGAGISGLACAYELKKMGGHPVVYEKEGHMGGRMTTFCKDGKIFAAGAQIFAKACTKMWELCDELGISNERKLLGNNVHYHLFKKGESTELNQSIFFSNYFPLSPTLRLAFFLLYTAWKARKHESFNLTKSGTTLQATPAKEYLYKTFGKLISDELLDPILFSITSLNLDDINLSEFLELFNLVRKFHNEVYYFANGMKTFYEELGKRVDVRLNQTVKKILPHQEGVEIKTLDGSQFYRAAVIAVDAPTARLIYQNPPPLHREILDQAEYKSVIILALNVPLEPIKNLPLVLFSPSESQLIHNCGCPYLYNKKTIVKGSKEIVNITLREQASLKLMNSFDEAIYSLVIAELLRILPFLSSYRDQITLFAIKKWERSLPKNRGKHVKKICEFWQYGQGINNVYLCGDYLNSPFVEGSIRCGQKTASLLLSNYR